MKWQAIANVTGQISDEAKLILRSKLEKDAAVELPNIWSDFILETSKHLQDSQSNIEVAASPKTGGLNCLTRFSSLHPDFLDNDKPFSQYALSKYDERAAGYLSKSNNPFTKRFLQQKIGEYKIQLTGQLAGFEAKLVEGKRHNMALEAIEKLKQATYDNPQNYSSNLQDSTLALSALSLLPLEKEKLLKDARAELAYAAALGTIKNSPESVANPRVNLSWKADLPLEQRLKIEQQASNMLEHRQHMMQQQVNALSHAHFASLLETGQGIKGFANLLHVSFAPSDPRRLELEEKEAQYRQAFLTAQQLKTASFAGSQAILQQLAPKAGEADYLQKDKLYNILTKQFTQQVKLASSDPAKLVEQLFAEEIPQELPLTQRLLLRKQLQEQKGIPPYSQKYLMQAEKADYLKRLQSEDASEVKQQIDNIMAIGKDDYQIGLELLQEVLEGETDLSVPVYFYAKNHLFNRDTARQFAQIIPIQKQLFSSASKEEVKELDKELNSNKAINNWHNDLVLASPHNIELANTTKRGIRELARFYQLTQGLSASSATNKAVEKVLDESYISPLDGLQLPKQIIHDGCVHDLNKGYIKDSLVNLRSAIIKGRVAFDPVATFGQNSADFAEKVQAALASGKWFLTPDDKKLYYAYELANGDFQALMTSPSQKLLFNLFDLSNPESEQSRRQRLEDEMQELLELPLVHIR